jgi:hypothetical protein
VYGGNCGCFEVDVDYLFWQPCISDQHYALKANGNFFDDESLHVKTHYFCPDWDSGVRATLRVNDIWCGYDGEVTYTYFTTDTSKSLSGQTYSIRPSNTVPDVNYQGDTIYLFGDYATAKWDLTYQTVDAVLSVPFEVGCRNGLNISAFSGIKWVNYETSRHEHYWDDDSPYLLVRRNLDVNGVGPTLGVRTKNRFCDCFTIFSQFSTSLIVGSSDNTDHFHVYQRNEEGEIINRYTNNDCCVCFPGLDFLAGVGYDFCICDWDFDLHIGWEYVHWFNAPNFTYYDTDQNGARSGSNDGKLSLQGLIAGLSVSF